MLAFAVLASSSVFPNLSPGGADCAGFLHLGDAAGTKEIDWLRGRSQLFGTPITPK